jgi:hypothetical protein
LNPFAPPRSEVGAAPIPKAPWHVITVAALLAIWGLVIAVGAVGWLMFEGTERVGLSDFYLALVTPAMTLCAAWLLWRRNRFATLALGGVLFIQVTVILISHRAWLGTSGSVAREIIATLPAVQVAFVGSCVLCLLYAMFLRRRGCIA